MRSHLRLRCLGRCYLWTFIIAAAVSSVGTPHRFVAADSLVTPPEKSYWAFRPVSAPPLPETKNPSWPQSAIDHFVLARLEAVGLRPAAAASPRELIRRVTVDLIGLPPTPEEVDAFVADSAPHAFAKVVDRLLDSPHYGERWGRYWLDVARYAEDDLYGPPGGSDYRNAWRYRDWVTQAFNEDMPYDLFLKAQIAGDLLDTPDSDRFVAGTGFLALGVWYYDSAKSPKARADERFDRIDVLTRGFLGLTVGCARCHDHKYDPISVADYYALDGIMASTVYREYPLAPPASVEAYQKHNVRTKEIETELKKTLDERSIELSGKLAAQTARYLMAAEHLLRQSIEDGTAAAKETGLDRELVESWAAYLAVEEKRHPYLQEWDDLRARAAPREELRKAAAEFQSQALAVFTEKKALDDNNRALVKAAREKQKVDLESIVVLPNGFRAGGACADCEIAITPIERTKYILWLDLFGNTDLTNSFNMPDYGLFRLRCATLERFLSKDELSGITRLRSAVAELKKTSPPAYPYLHSMGESARPRDAQIQLRGNPYRLGDETPRRFLTVLSREEPTRFTEGSGRLQLAQAVANHPLAARVLVNRVWHHHFGRGIVSTPSNFGQLGTAPTHPQLLEYLTYRFIQSGYSVKTLHREILLSATYRLSSRDTNDRNSNDHISSVATRTDPDNRLLWRANRRRLDAESLRDSLLFAAGQLDRSLGGPSVDFSVDLSEGGQRRTLYARVKRSKLNRLLALFDFPEPSLTSDERSSTNVPLQRLFFLNSDFIWNQAGSLAKRLGSDDNRLDEATMKRIYRHLFQRPATQAELELALSFLQERSDSGANEAPGLQQYLQVLLSSNEFLYVD